MKTHTDNYFDFFELPISFLIDSKVLKQRFLQNSKQFHPDFHTLAQEEEQENALQMSTLNNQAYQTLADQDLRTAYILQLTQTIADNERYQLPADFLSEMMELNEAIDELDTNNEQQIGKLQQQLEQLSNKLQTQSQNLFKDYEQTENKQPVLLEIKKCYYKMKYLLRIREKLPTFAPQ